MPRHHNYPRFHLRSPADRLERMARNDDQAAGRRGRQALAQLGYLRRAGLGYLGGAAFDDRALDQFVRDAVRRAQEAWRFALRAQRFRDEAAALRAAAPPGPWPLHQQLIARLPEIHPEFR
jgi:hypothetical protein